MKHAERARPAVGPHRRPPAGRLLGALLLAGLSQVAAANPELAREKGCLGCHAVDQRVVGPAFTEVAKRYAGKPAALETVGKHIREGLKGAWGDLPMPPQAHVNAAEAEALGRWILAAGR